jgi:hypothetical protein
LHNLQVHRQQTTLQAKFRKALVVATIRIRSKDSMAQDNPDILTVMEWAWAVASSNPIVHQPPLLSLSFLDANPF